VLAHEVPQEGVHELRRHERTGRPFGGERFLARLERLVGRVLHPGKAGRKPKARK